MCGSMVRSGSCLTPRFRIEVLCLIVSAPTVSVTLFENYGLPLNISLSLFNLSPLCAIQWLTSNRQSSNLLIAICILEGLEVYVTAVLRVTFDHVGPVYVIWAILLVILRKWDDLVEPDTTEPFCIYNELKLEWELKKWQRPWFQIDREIYGLKSNEWKVEVGNQPALLMVWMVTKTLLTFFFW